MIWGRLQKICINVPQSTLLSIFNCSLHTFLNSILNWWSLQQPGLFLELVTQPKQTEEKGLGKRGDQELSDDSGLAPEIMCGDGRNLQKDNHHYNLSGHTHTWNLPKGLPDYVKQFSGLMNFSYKHHIWRKPKELVVSCCGGAFQRQGLGQGRS